LVQDFRGILKITQKIKSKKNHPFDDSPERKLNFFCVLRLRKIDSKMQEKKKLVEVLHQEYFC